VMKRKRIRIAKVQCRSSKKERVLHANSSSSSRT
jgi:hypothetical protein